VLGERGVRRELYWLNYIIDGERCAFIIEALNILLARREADVAGMFMGGDPLDAESAAKVPPGYVGRLLRRAEFLELQRAVAVPTKKPPAKSIPAKAAARARAERAIKRA
jgi:hypothetical protein